MRAQKQEQWRLQQENALWAAANYNNPNVTFKQYLQVKNNCFLPMGAVVFYIFFPLIYILARLVACQIS